MNRTITLAAPMAVPDTQQEVLAQEVAIVAFRRHASLRDPQALDGWLYRTAVRAALREAKRSRTRRDAERAAAVPETAADADAVAVARLLAGLPPRQRAALTLRYDDGSYAAPGEAPAQQPTRDADVRRAEMAIATAWLIAESNATPELRAAGFGVLERFGGARDLGTVRDAEDRAGRGLEISWGGTLRDGDRWSSALLIFDSATGEVLSTRVAGNVGKERHSSEYTYLRAEHTRSIPR